jgi:hypothetical protein
MSKATKQQSQWSSGLHGQVDKVAVKSTQFETEVARLGLATSEYADSAELKTWCEAHKNSRYIPEWLLKAYEMVTDWDETEKKPTTLTTIIPFDELQEVEEAAA